MLHITEKFTCPGAILFASIHAFRFVAPDKNLVKIHFATVAPLPAVFPVNKDLKFVGNNGDGDVVKGAGLSATAPIRWVATLHSAKHSYSVTARVIFVTLESIVIVK